jgi:hypothetical protein
MDGQDVCPEPLEERRKRLAKLLSRKTKAMRDGIQLSQAITRDGARIFRHACWMDLEGCFKAHWLAIRQRPAGMAEDEEPGFRATLKELLRRADMSRNPAPSERHVAARAAEKASPWLFIPARFLLTHQTPLGSPSAW